MGTSLGKGRLRNWGYSGVLAVLTCLCHAGMEGLPGTGSGASECPGQFLLLGCTPEWHGCHIFQVAVTSSRWLSQPRDGCHSPELGVTAVGMGVTALRWLSHLPYGCHSPGARSWKCQGREQRGADRGSRSMRRVRHQTSLRLGQTGWSLSHLRASFMHLLPINILD